MAELKTNPNDGDVQEFLESTAKDDRLKDCMEIMNLMEEITGEPAKMWGGSIVGFGTYTYKYSSGRTGDWMLTAFSPRKQNITIYIMDGFDKHPALMKTLGKFKTGKSCLYVKSLDDVDKKVLKKLITQSVKNMKSTGR